MRILLCSLGFVLSAVPAAASPQKNGQLLFSIPVGAQGIEYRVPAGREGERLGPTSVSVAPDGAIWIADPIGHRVRSYSVAGTPLSTVALPDSVIGVRDVEAMADSLWLLDVAAPRPHVVRISKDGSVLEDHPVASSADNLVSAGPRVYVTKANALHEVLLPDASRQRASQNATRAGAISAQHEANAIAVAGTSIQYNGASGTVTVNGQPVQVTTEGGLRMADMSEAGTVFVLVEVASGRNGTIHVEQSVRGIDARGRIIADYVVPLADQYLFVEHPVAVAPNGDIYALVTNPDRVEVRLLGSAVTTVPAASYRRAGREVGRVTPIPQ